MPRNLRLEYEGAIYHLMNRGDHREDIFVDEKDRARFLETLGETCQKTDWQVHGFCLMQNHFHLVVETPKANLSVGMQWLLGTYTARFNRRHRFFGHLFSGRFKSLIVDGSGNGYLKTVCDYVHLNLVRANLLREGEPLESYGWSGYPQYLKAPEARPKWLRTDRLFGAWGVQQDDAAGRRQFAGCMEERCVQERNKQAGDWNRLRRGWCCRSKTLRQDMLECIEQVKGIQHHGTELLESSEQKAARLLEQMLREAGWQQTDLRELPKGDQGKARMAARLRTETTMTWPWIAQQLEMGHWRTAANAVNQERTSLATVSQ